MPSLNLLPFNHTSLPESGGIDARPQEKDSPRNLETLLDHKEAVQLQCLPAQQQTGHPPLQGQFRCHGGASAAAAPHGSRFGMYRGAAIRAHEMAEGFIQGDAHPGACQDRL